MKLDPEGDIRMLVFNAPLPCLLCKRPTTNGWVQVLGTGGDWRLSPLCWGCQHNDGQTQHRLTVISGGWQRLN